MDRLINKVNANIQHIQNAEADFSEYLNISKTAINSLEQGIEAGWEQLNISEGQTLLLFNQINKVQSNIASLSGEAVLNSIRSKTVEDCRDVYTKVGSICYSMVVNGLSFPYLSVGILAFTFGNTIYRIFQNAAEFEKEVEKLQQLSRQFSMEEKAMVQTKMMIRLLYALHEMAKEQRNPIQQITTFWQNEKRNLETVKKALAFAAVYKKENLEIMQLAVAENVWKMLAHIAGELLTWLNQNVETDPKQKLEILV